MIPVVGAIIIFSCPIGLSVGWQNVALSANGGTCRSGAVKDMKPCTYAIDGLLWYNRGWVVYHQGVGMWIKINFRTEYVLTYGRVMQQFSRQEQIRKIKLDFSGSRFVEKHLVKRNGDTRETYVGQIWDEFSLDYIQTHFVQISVLDVYSIQYNGFIEVEFYTGINMCPMFYTFLDGKCYRYHYPQHLPWREAFQFCQQDCADLANIDSEDKLSTVLIWLNKGVHREGRFWVHNINSNHIALSKPEVTRSNFTLSIHGIMSPVASRTPLCLICERDPKVPCRTEEARHAGEPSYAADIDHAEGPIESKLADNYVIILGLVLCCVVVGLVHVVLFIIGGQSGRDLCGDDITGTQRAKKGLKPETSTK